MSTIKTLRDALEKIAGLYEDNADANSIRQASLLYDSRCIARTALTEAAAKDASALEAVPVLAMHPKQESAYKTLVAALRGQIAHLQKEVAQKDEAVNTLASERAANALLTEELARTAPPKQEAAPVRLHGKTDMLINGLEFVAPWALISQAGFDYEFKAAEAQPSVRGAHKAGMLAAATIADQTKFEGQYCTTEDCKAAGTAIRAAAKAYGNG